MLPFTVLNSRSDSQSARPMVALTEPLTVSRARDAGGLDLDAAVHRLRVRVGGEAGASMAPLTVRAARRTPAGTLTTNSTFTSLFFDVHPPLVAGHALVRARPSALG